MLLLGCERKREGRAWRAARVAPRCGSGFGLQAAGRGFQTHPQGFCPRCFALQMSTHPGPRPSLCCAATRAQEGRWAEALSVLPVVTCAPDTPLREVIRQLVEYRKHRWVGW